MTTNEQTRAANSTRSVVESVRTHLASCGPEERLLFLRDVMAGYCPHCGYVERGGMRCQCENDE